MLEVNVTNLKNELVKMETIIHEYEEIELNLFHQLNDSCVNWQDGNSQIFSDKIDIEQRETNELLDLLKNEQETYQFIVDKYQTIGKKIECQLAHKQSILSAVEECKSGANSVISSFDGVDSGISGSIYSAIMDQKRKVQSVLEQLSSFASAVTNMYAKIEQIEREIGAKMRMLKEINIQEFTFHELTGGINE